MDSLTKLALSKPIPDGGDMPDKKTNNRFVWQAGDIEIINPKKTKTKPVSKNLRAQTLIALKATPDLAQLMKIYQKYQTVYSGKHIDRAAKAWKKGDFQTAMDGFEASRDGFQQKKNPVEWNTLEAWRAAAEAKAAEKQPDTGQDLLVPDDEDTTSKE